MPTTRLILHLQLTNVLSRDVTGGYARWEVRAVGARSNHLILRWRARLADRETGPAIVDSRHSQRETPTLYWLCRKATHICTPRHTHYILPSVATSADRRNTSTHDGLPATTSLPCTNTLRRTLSPSTSKPDTG